MCRPNKELKDPILILGEAYARCKDTRDRKVIATAVRHAFMALGVKGKDDAEFVKNAMQWYSQNKDRLELDWMYADNDRSFGPSYDKRPLFKIKPSGNQTKGGKGG